jgi:hypothetical protein
MEAGVPMRRALERVIKLDPAFEGGLAHAVLGRWYFRTPRWLGGNRKSADEHLRRALAFDPRPAASTFYFAEFLIEEERAAEARAELAKLIAAPVDPRWMADDREIKERAALLLKELETSTGATR